MRNAREQRLAALRVEIANLWQLMTSMYGHRWVSAYGDEVDPDGVWLATLRDISPLEIRKGFGALRESGGEWPPSAPQFRAMCVGAAEHWEHKRIAAADAQKRALPAAKPDPRSPTARREKERLRAILAGLAPLRGRAPERSAHRTAYNDDFFEREVAGDAEI